MQTQHQIAYTVTGMNRFVAPGSMGFLPDRTDLPGGVPRFGGAGYWGDLMPGGIRHDCGRDPAGDVVPEYLDCMADAARRLLAQLLSNDPVAPSSPERRPIAGRIPTADEAVAKWLASKQAKGSTVKQLSGWLVGVDLRRNSITLRTQCRTWELELTEPTPSGVLDLLGKRIVVTAACRRDHDLNFVDGVALHIKEPVLIPDRVADFRATWGCFKDDMAHPEVREYLRELRGHGEYADSL